jgi:hypothetical protein
MKIITYQGERNLSELAKRMFSIRGQKAGELSRKAEAAILEANPRLKDLKNVPEGTLLVVPDVPGVAAGGADPGFTLGKEMVAQLRHALSGARAAIERSADSEVKQAKETTALVKSREIKDSVKGQPDLASRLPRIAEESNARVKDAESLKSARTQALDQLEKDLESVAALLGAK